MKILVGTFQCESNTFSEQAVGYEDFNVFEGNAVTEKLEGAQYLLRQGIEVIPLIYAVALPSGKVARGCFDRLVGLFTEKIREAGAFDGIYLYLHGSMYVEGLGSGEANFVRRLREVVEDHIPISVALDFHANLPGEFFLMIDVVQGFRTAPHTDHADTERRAAKSLVKIIKNNQRSNVRWIHLPFLVGDAATTDKEPFLTINRFLEEYDSQPTVVSAAFFSGQPWFDASFTGGCAVVATTDDSALEKAAAMAEVYWNERSNLVVPNSRPYKQAVIDSLENKKNTLFISDSGDNTTAGSKGDGTLLLSEYLKADAESVLVAGITDADAVSKVMPLPIGEKVDLVLNRGEEFEQLVEVTVTADIVGKGEVFGWSGEVAGSGVLLRKGGVDFVLTERRAAFTSPTHFEKMGIDPLDYRVVAVKLGYLFPGIESLASSHIFALTPGQSSSDFKSMNYQQYKGERDPAEPTLEWTDILALARKEYDDATLT